MFSTRPTWSRRDYVRAGSLGFFGLNLASSLRLQAAPAKAKSCILLWLEGGPAQMDTFDPKPNSSFRPIATNVPGIQVSELLPKLAKRMDKLALIRSMSSFGDDHPQAVHYAATGHLHNPAMQFPSLGAIVGKELGAKNAMPPYAIVPKWESGRQYEDYFRSAFLGADYDPMLVPDPAKGNFEVADMSLPKSVTPAAIDSRQAFRRIVEKEYRARVESAEHAKLDAFQTKALEMLLTPSVRDAFDLSKEDAKTRDNYGRDSVGQSLLLARRLVEAGTRFVTAAGYHGSSWDTHSDNDRLHRDRLTPPLDRGLSALIDDLAARGLYQETMIVVMGEFGRTPHINAALGRDHWPKCWSLAIGGGGLKTGLTVGKSDERAANVVERKTSIGDLFATVYKAMGIDWHREYMTPIGRPIKIANSFEDTTGEPVGELF
ncbi:MAG: DUF1501 domain-containing protein [Acidobacteria bacterium]|nr:DUF1501 domain-containing protein [Acidobacteriota bacterium]